MEFLNIIFYKFLSLAIGDPHSGYIDPGTAFPFSVRIRIYRAQNAKLYYEESYLTSAIKAVYF
jgi:hypothetical protein